MYLKLEKEADFVYEQLHSIKRAGWVERRVADPESVKEHTESLVKLATNIYPELTAEEKDGLIDMLEVHDWPEAIEGDVVILELEPGQRAKLKKDKFQREKRAMQQICSKLENGDILLEKWIRFETSNDPAAKFARELDKYQAVELALEYELEQGIDLFDEFLKYSINFIHHPILLNKIDNLKKRKSKKLGA